MASLQSHLDKFKYAFEYGAPPYNAPREDHRNEFRGEGNRGGPRFLGYFVDAVREGASR